MSYSAISSLAYLHDVPIHSYPLFSPPIGLPRKPAPIGTARKLKPLPTVHNVRFNRLELLLAIAHATTFKDGHSEVSLEVEGLKYSIARHLKTSVEVGFNAPAKSTTKFPKLPYAEFIRSTLNGKVGNGIAALFARRNGTLYLAHFEDVLAGAIISQSHRIPSKKSTPAKTIYIDRSPDFITVDKNDIFGVLEAKGTHSPYFSKSFLTDPVLKALREQVDTYVGGTITPSGRGLGQVISKGWATGMVVAEPETGSQLHVCEVQNPITPPSVLKSHSLSGLHFDAWIRLFDSAFWETNMRADISQTPYISVANSKFYVVPVSSSFLQLDKDNVENIRHVIGIRGLNGDARWYSDDDIMIGIEENVFNALRAYKDPYSIESESNVSLHRAVLQFSQEKYEIVKSDIEPRNGLSRIARACAVFPEGIIGFHGLSLFDLLFDT